MNESTSLYRRHRPGSFDEVVGQQHVVRTLRNAVEQGKVHHAYLFVGSRGTGKTSMAKILARSLNCERGGPTATPCGECDSCRTIAAGTSMDVIEMDAASNRSVDDVRELRERVAYAPSGGRWKVYILDEAHMLTKEAWNAFLKTLEEPPPNTVFVLATTEAHRVMPTIADRCQRFDFQRPSPEQIAEVLERVAAAEGIEPADGVVATIARAASGSFRDALGTLDQLVAFGGERIALDDALELLGVADAELLFGAVDAVIAADPKAVLLKVEEMSRSGRDPAWFARDLLAHLRHLLVTQTVGEVPGGFAIAPGDEARLSAQAGAIGAATLVRTIDELANALTNVREGDEARLAVEIALLKAARPDLDPSTEGLLRRVEQLERRGESAGPRVLSRNEVGPAVEDDRGHPHPESDIASDPTPSADRNPPAGGEGERASPEERRPVFRPNDSARAESSPGEKPSDGGDALSPTTGPAGRSTLDLDAVKQCWPAALEKLREESPALAATFEGARPVGLDEEGLTIGFPPDSTFNKRKAEAPDKRELMAAALEAVAGERLRPVYVLLEEKAEPESAPVPPDEPGHEEMLDRLKSEFDAEEVG